MIAHCDGQVLWGYGMTEHATAEGIDRIEVMAGERP
jgi:hypothetical protein